MLASKLRDFGHREQGTSFSDELVAFLGSDAQRSADAIQFSTENGPIEILDNLLAGIDRKA